MGVDHAGGGQLALAIHYLGLCKASRHFCAHIDNLFILNSDILQLPIRSMQ